MQKLLRLRLGKFLSGTSLLIHGSLSLLFNLQSALRASFAYIIANRQRKERACQSLSLPIRRMQGGKCGNNSMSRKSNMKKRKCFIKEFQSKLFKLAFVEGRKCQESTCNPWPLDIAAALTLSRNDSGDFSHRRVSVL